MSSEVTFEDIVELKIDNRGKTPPIVSVGHPLVEVNALVNCGLHPNISKVSKFVDDETWETWFRQHLQKDDVVFSTVGTIGETAIVSNEPNYGIAQNILGFRFKKGLVSPLYILYLMRSSWFVHQVTGRTIETVQKSIKWSDMRGIKLSLPPVPTQEKIAKILGDLDRKIELNKRMNETLEQIGQTLFKHYFVDNPERENWKESKLSDLSSINKETVNKNYAKKHIHYIDIASVGTGVVDNFQLIKFSEAPSRAKRIVSPEDIIWSTVRPNRRSFALLSSPPQDTIASTGFVTITANDNCLGYVYYLVSNPDFTDYLVRRAKGAAYPAVLPSDFVDAPVAIPPNALLKEFNSLAGPLLSEKNRLNKESENLSKMRDVLLPKLISGEITI